MILNQLGNTGIMVSELCFGALTIGPLQANLGTKRGGEIIACALNNGINFIDTAQLYDTYPAIGYALKLTQKQPVIASKCYAYDKAGAIYSVEKARSEMNVDVIDIFLLHERENKEQIIGHYAALEQFHKFKAQGIIKAVGISTHYVQAAKAAARMSEIDVIHPLLNMTGVGIADGSVEDMQNALEIAAQNGKGVYLMKLFGGGLLVHDTRSCVQFFKQQSFAASVAIGMQSEAEVYANIALMDGCPIPDDAKAVIDRRRPKLWIGDWCEGCGNCAKRCGQSAIKIVENTAMVDRTKCVQCGYCAKTCPVFAIRIV